MKLKEALSKYGEYEVKEQELEKIIEKPKRWEYTKQRNNINAIRRISNVL